jgi:hypothetical protein
MVFAFSLGDFATMLGDVWYWAVWGVDRCGQGPERWGETCWW